MNRVGSGFVGTPSSMKSYHYLRGVRRKFWTRSRLIWSFIALFDLAIFVVLVLCFLGWLDFVDVLIFLRLWPNS